MHAPPPYTLTPVDIQDLRGSVRFPKPLDGTGAAIAAPFITWSESEAQWELHAYGALQGRHARIAIVSSCLRYERTEPGFIRRVLDPANTCDEAALDHSAFEAAKRLRESRAIAAQRQLEDTQQATEVKLALKYVSPAEISLDDLLR